jgi:fatty acid desaturase
MIERKLEWQTIALAVVCYIIWLSATWSYQHVEQEYGIFAVCLLLITIVALASAFHTSIQHEVVHGHPTPLPLVNEAIIFPSLIFAYPFRRYRDLHLKHHIDANLTDPYEDPESYYWPECDQTRLNPVMKILLGMNNTFFGRMILGPPLGLFGFYKTEFVRLRQNETGVRKAWVLHIIGSLPVLLWITAVCGIPIWLYVVLVVFPGVSWILARSFAEHQASVTIGGRTAIVEAHPFFSLLFLNNNLHMVHHAHPQAAWYDLPAMYHERKQHYLAANDSYLFEGYWSVIRQFAIHKKQPVFHPIYHLNSNDTDPVADGLEPAATQKR